MANALVVRNGTDLAKRIKALHAAQYVRMSTDYQRYSIENQAAAIAAYAQQHNLIIVHTYRDEGRSGLRIRTRPGLTELIEDVRLGRADFDHVLVYDVSRWGRFQDVDESAHYEFICKQNGIKVVYCAEQFDNDGSLLSSIVKNIKRVMAAEFSRELSVKVHTGQSRVASLGFRVGGPPTFGVHRTLVGEDRRSKGRLEKGEAKSLKTDRVRLALGSPEETTIVRWIFHQFVAEKKTDIAIARELNQGRIANQHDRPWTDGMIHRILCNENYIGHIVYNRTSRRLGQKLVNNPLDRWIRSDLVTEPIVDRDIFAEAQKIMADRYVSVSEDEMLKRLRLLLKRKGQLTSSVIKAAPGMPSVACYIMHFGTLRKAFDMIGYTSPRDCDWIDSKQHWLDVVETQANELKVALKQMVGKKVCVDKGKASLVVDGKARIHIQIARQTKRRPNHAPVWRVYRRRDQSGLLVIMRLNETNRAIMDYLLLPAAKLTRRYLRFSARGDERGATRVGTVKALAAAVKGQLRGSLRRHASKSRTIRAAPTN
ncbi:recombinase family protein [Bradyrhizobium sp. LB11.1]|uniref:recombinase family protein n=1 Tax=Bradyrhizobium sp. LB11.1 TaxID=3156326 RepID=UPI00339A3877